MASSYPKPKDRAHPHDLRSRFNVGYSIDRWFNKWSHRNSWQLFSLKLVLCSGVAQVLLRCCSYVTLNDHNDVEGLKMFGVGNHPTGVIAGQIQHTRTLHNNCVIGCLLVGKLPISAGDAWNHTTASRSGNAAFFNLKSSEWFPGESIHSPMDMDGTAAPHKSPRPRAFSASPGSMQTSGLQPLKEYGSSADWQRGQIPRERPGT